MLTIFRRHKKSCQHRRQGRSYRRCRCPISVEGYLEGQEVRKSLNLCDWEKAQEFVREREARGFWESPSNYNAHGGPISIADVGLRFVADAEARQLTEETIKKYKRLFKKLEIFAERRGIIFIQGLTVDVLSSFRSSWKLGPRTSVKELERLRGLLDFARDREWITKNPALELKAPKPKPRPTLPFTHEEIIRVLAALDTYGKRAGVMNAQRLRAFVLLLRYSGMRIGDTVSCGVDRITNNRLFLYTQKTGVPVYCILPDFVVAALEASPRPCEHFYFWSGASKLHSAVGKWQRRLKRLFELAQVAKGHAHRFRDTFAVELLLAGLPIERVSVLLGHQSIRVTERHYSPWTRSRQDQLEADLARAWSQDPVVLLEANHTPNPHGDKVHAN